MAGNVDDPQIQRLRDWLPSLCGVSTRSFYVVVDSARDPSIQKSFANPAVESVSLYRGEPEETLAAVAPYLIRIDHDAGLLSSLLTNGWGESWGIFLIADTDIERVRRHLRRFLLVLDPDGAELYFRFYDPRVLRVYLPTCTASEMKRFFGPVATYLVETEDGQGVTLFSRQGARTIPLGDLSSHSGSELIGEQNVAENLPKSNIGRLKIRHEQMQALTDYMNTSFLRRAALHLRQQHPKPTKPMSDSDLNQLINAGSDRAAACGLMRETEIVLFLELMVLFGSDFDQRLEWAGAILQNPDLPPEEKVEALQERRDAVQSIGEHA